MAEPRGRSSSGDPCDGGTKFTGCEPMQAEGVRMKQDSRRPLLLLRGGALNGCQRQMLYLAEGLVRSAYEPVAVAPHRDGLLRHLAWMGVETHCMPLRDWRRFPEAMGRPLDTQRLRRLATARNVDLIHAADFWKGRYAIRIGRLLNIPSVVHVRGPFQPRDVRKHRLHQASALIAIAQRYADDLPAAGVLAENVTTIDDGVDTSVYRPWRPGDGDALKPLCPRPGGLRIGLVGRIEPFKCQREFIETVAPIVKATPDAATFFLVGPIADERYHQQILQAIQQHGIGNRIVLTGRYDDMPGVMRSLDVLVTLSGGGVMFEAMACGKAVVSVREDGQHSTHVRHGDTALRVTSRDPRDATAELRRLIDDEDLRQRLGVLARRWAESWLSSERTAEKTIDLYDRLVGRPVAPTLTTHGGETVGG